MRFIPALFFALAIAVSLCVQSLKTPLAGAWLFFILCSCAAIYSPPKNKELIWLSSAAWLFTLGLSTFILAPVSGGAATMFILSAMPIVAISVDESQIKNFLIAAFIVLFAYALLLNAEMFFHIHYTTWEYGGPFGIRSASSWPLLDPNNAACIMNIGLIPSFYMALKKPRWFLVCLVFALALFFTSSRTGGICAVIACSILLVERFPSVKTVFIAVGILAFIGFSFIDIFHVASIADRLSVWHGCISLLEFKPFTGTGIGTFIFYYSQIRTEHATLGVYAHNDLMQLAIEMGFPCVCVFIMLAVIVLFTTWQRNQVSFCVMLAVFLHSMMEFQFYIPSVSLLMGLALAYHRINSRVLANSKLD